MHKIISISSITGKKINQYLLKMQNIYQYLPKTEDSFFNSAEMEDNLSISQKVVFYTITHETEKELNKMIKTPGVTPESLAA